MQSADQYADHCHSSCSRSSDRKDICVVIISTYRAKYKEHISRFIPNRMPRMVASNAVRPSVCEIGVSGKEKGSQDERVGAYHYHSIP